MNTLQRKFTGEDRRRVVVKATPAKLTLITCSGTLTMGMQGRSEETVKRIFESEIPERMVRSDWRGAEQLLRNIELRPTADNCPFYPGRNVRPGAAGEEQADATPEGAANAIL